MLGNNDKLPVERSDNRVQRAGYASSIAMKGEK